MRIGKCDLQVYVVMINEIAEILYLILNIYYSFNT